MMNSINTHLISQEIEEAVLGGLILDKNTIYEINESISPEYFAIEANKNIVKAINDLKNQGIAIDMLTVVDQLRKNNTLLKSGGAAYVASLTNRVASNANAQYHFRIIQQLWIGRSMDETCSRIQAELKNGKDGLDVLDLYRSKLNEIDKVLTNNVNFDKSDYMKFATERNKKIFENKGITGVPSTFTDIDRLTGGWQKTDLIILAARPAMGKTALALQYALEPATEYRIATAYFSLEVSGPQLMDRAVSIKSGLKGEKIKRDGLKDGDWVLFQECSQMIIRSPIYIDDTPALTITKFQSKARKMVNEFGVKLIVIDYLQLMVNDVDGKNTNREQQISGISRALKATAKELDIPVIALSQLSRSVETRGGDKRPMLSDLRESGAIEQDADIVTFLYRPEYYDITDIDGKSTEGVAYVDFAKHRGGKLDDIQIKWDPEHTKFENHVPKSFSYIKRGDAPDAYRSPMPQNEEFENEHE